MIRVLFICHGNICRSPMAEFIFRSFIESADLGDSFQTDSAAVSREEIGNSISFHSKEVLKQHGIPIYRHYARQINQEDLDSFHYIIAMDRNNIDLLEQMFDMDSLKNVHLLMNFTDRPGEVADPWYTRDYETAFTDIYEGCSALFTKLLGVYTAK